MKLYHGTNCSSAQNIFKEGINLKYSKPYLDFGSGFYTTPSYEHAAITALRVTDKYNAKNGTNEEPYIVEIDFDCRKANLTMISYPRHCKEWGNFILNNRLTDKTLKAYNITVHNQDARYDVCWGEIADGNIVNIAYQVNEGIISLEDVDFNNFLKANGRVFPLQYSFHTPKAISCINVLSCGTIHNKQKYQDKIGRR